MAGQLEERISDSVRQVLVETVAGAKEEIVVFAVAEFEAEVRRRIAGIAVEVSQHFSVISQGTDLVITIRGVK